MMLCSDEIRSINFKHCIGFLTLLAVEGPYLVRQTVCVKPGGTGVVA